MQQALCIGCDQNFPVGPKAEAIIAEAKHGIVQGYCANVRRKVSVVLVPAEGHWSREIFLGTQPKG